jgi:hypothetical protein
MESNQSITHELKSKEMATHSSTKRRRIENENIEKFGQKFSQRIRKTIKISLNNDSINAKIDKIFNFYFDLLKTKLENKNYKHLNELIINSYRLFIDLKTNNKDFLRKKSFLKLINRVSDDIATDLDLDQILLFHNSFVQTLNIVLKKNSICDQFNDRSDDVINNCINNIESNDNQVFQSFSGYETEIEEDLTQELDVNYGSSVVVNTNSDKDINCIDNDINKSIENNINYEINNNDNRSDVSIDKIVDSISDECIQKETIDIIEDDVYQYKGTIYPEINESISCLIDDFIKDPEKKWIGFDGRKYKTIPIFYILNKVKEVMKEKEINFKESNLNVLVDKIFIDVKKIVISAKKTQLIIID